MLSNHGVRNSEWGVNRFSYIPSLSLSHVSRVRIIIIIIIWGLFGVNDFALKRIQARSGWVDQFLSEKNHVA
jgi:hypothetical protein